MDILVIDNINEPIDYNAHDMTGGLEGGNFDYTTRTEKPHSLTSLKYGSIIVYLFTTG